MLKLSKFLYVKQGKNNSLKVLTRPVCRDVLKPIALPKATDQYCCAIGLTCLHCLVEPGVLKLFSPVYPLPAFQHKINPLFFVYSLAL